MEKFQKELREWIKIDEQVKIYQKKINKLNIKKNKLTPNLIEYMNKKKIDDIKINSNYKLNLKTKNQYSGISKKYLHEILSKNLEKEKANNLIEIIYKKRNIKQNYSIQIIKNK